MVKRQIRPRLLPSMASFFDVKTIFFTLWGYPMSYIEFCAVAISGLATWLVARNNVWTWPIAVVSVVLFFFLFYQVQLYPDMFLQVFFLITYLLGWWRWTHSKKGEAVIQDSKSSRALRITRMPPRQLVIWTLASVVATVALGHFASNLHILFPVLFSKPSAFPYLDSFTTVMSIAGTFMMIEKWVECWYVWLVIDLLSTYMYFTKDVKLVGIEYFVFCFIAALGAWTWTREYQRYQI